MFDRNEEIVNHINSLRPEKVDLWRRIYESDHFVILSDVLPASIFDDFVAEARFLLSQNAQRREMNIEESGNTKRAYDSVAQSVIRKEGVFIPAVFDSDEFLSLISEITNQKLHRVPYVPEEFIINSQSKPNDTHGWHWDDYAFAVIWCIDECDPLLGGRVEYVPNVHWNKQNTEQHLINILKSRTVNSVHLRKGECYLMKTNTCLHRVSPLTGPSKRSVVVMTYASDSDLSDTSITHKSMEQIYDGS